MCECAGAVDEDDNEDAAEDDDAEEKKEVMEVFGGASCCESCPDDELDLDRTVHVKGPISA